MVGDDAGGERDALADSSPASSPAGGEARTEAGPDIAFSVDVCFWLCVCAVCGKKESRGTSNLKIGDD